jgi:hypothetical protein
VTRTGYIGSACLMLGVLLLSACGARPPESGSSAVATPPGDSTGTDLAPGASPAAAGAFQALASQAAAPHPAGVTFAPAKGVPPAAVQAVSALLVDPGLKPSLVTGGPDLDVRMQPTAGDRLAYERILVPVDRFPSPLEAVSSQGLRAVWSGSGTSPDYSTIYPSRDALAELELLLGPPGPSVLPQASDAVSEAVWSDPSGIGIVPFDALEPRLRALQLDSRSVVDNKLESGDWPLALRAWLHPRTEQGKRALALAADIRPTTNRDLDKMTVIAMTGVTAMARNTAVAIEKAGDDAFPARIVGPVLAAADITTISNEVPFFDGCIADNTLNNMTLCSRPEYWAALELSGVDAIGFTGNHMNDFGYDDDLATLEFYRKKGVPVYGGGANDAAARVPLILEDHGNRLAFLGANEFGPEEYPAKSGALVSAWAGPANPGAARFDLQQMTADIKAIKPRVDLVFAEVQYTEFNANGDYQTEPLPEQVTDFQALKDAGADVVTGVQAHAPQAIELRDHGIILYGLGNLYFDQTWSWPTRTGLVVWHTVYEGRLLNTHLSVTVIDPNFQLRWAIPREQRDVLESVYAASGW